jgi:predicted nucleic acid-binding protein
VRHVDEPSEAEAWDWLRRHDEREYSFVDATSFVVMRRLRLLEAMGMLGEFAAGGFVEARPLRTTG